MLKIKILLLFLSFLFVISANLNGQQLRIVGWGYHVYPYIPEGTEFKKVAAGATHSLALTRYGKVYAWGRKEYNQCIVPQEIQGKVVSISAGSRQNMVIIKISETR